MSESLYVGWWLDIDGNAPAYGVPPLAQILKLLQDWKYLQDMIKDKLWAP